MCFCLTSIVHAAVMLYLTSNNGAMSLHEPTVLLSMIVGHGVGHYYRRICTFLLQFHSHMGLVSVVWHLQLTNYGNLLIDKFIDSRVNGY